MEGFLKIIGDWCDRYGKSTSYVFSYVYVCAHVVVVIVMSVIVRAERALLALGLPVHPGTRCSVYVLFILSFAFTGNWEWE